MAGPNDKIARLRNNEQAVCTCLARQARHLFVAFVWHFGINSNEAFMG
jgi:hypothetical protein